MPKRHGAAEEDKIRGHASSKTDKRPTGGFVALRCIDLGGSRCCLPCSSSSKECVVASSNSVGMLSETPLYIKGKTALFGLISISKSDRKNDQIAVTFFQFICLELPAWRRSLPHLHPICLANRAFGAVQVSRPPIFK